MDSNIIIFDDSRDIIYYTFSFIILNMIMILSVLAT